jgi:hypothetical protein
VTACIYCNYKDQSWQTVLNLISSVLRQLVQDHDRVYKVVKPLYKHHLYKGIPLTCQWLLEALKWATEKFSKVFLVVNALDKCSSETWAELLIALQHLSSTMSLLITSCDLTPDSHGIMPLDIQANYEDVQSYTEGQIPLTDLQIHVNRDQTLQEDIMKAITSNIEGMLVSYM